MPGIGNLLKCSAVRGKEWSGVAGLRMLLDYDYRGRKMIVGVPIVCGVGGGLLSGGRRWW